MFVRDFVHVGQPFESVAPRFVADTSWLSPIAEEAIERARDVVVSLFDEGDHLRERFGPVHLEIGPARARATSLLVPMWLLSGSGGPAGTTGAGGSTGSTVPDLSGDLEVAPVGATRSLLAFGATYRRPAQEAVTTHRVERVAESAVRSFLDGIATALARPVSAI